MSLLVKITLAAALILSIAVPFGAFAMGEKSKGRYKKALACNMVLFFGVMAVSAGLMFTGNAYAAEEAASAVSSSAAPPARDSSSSSSFFSRENSSSFAMSRAAAARSPGLGRYWFKSVSMGASRQMVPSS